VRRGLYIVLDEKGERTVVRHIEIGVESKLGHLIFFFCEQERLGWMD
jgi:hypothetical protein